MEKEKIKEKSLLQRLWTDPVLSQILSVGILAFLTIIYSFLKTIFKEISIRQAFVDTLNYQLELYKVFILLTVVVLSYIAYYKWKQKRNKFLGRFDTEQRIGDFSFKELYNALLTHNVKLPASLVNPQTGNQGDLLTLFTMFNRTLNLGVEWDHPGDQGEFLYHVLGPTLMSFGLTEKAPTKKHKKQIPQDLIQTSQTGHKFYALLERWRIYHGETMQD